MEILVLEDPIRELLMNASGNFETLAIVIQSFAREPIRRFERRGGKESP